jgi:hypothetical protein
MYIPFLPLHASFLYTALELHPPLFEYLKAARDLW